MATRNIKTEMEDIKMHCQLTTLKEIMLPHSSFESISQKKIKKIWDLKKKVKAYKNKVITYPKESRQQKIILNEIPLPGEIVRVKSETEIKKILDEYDSTGGCVFAPEMFKYCNKNFKVYKIVRQFYDEVKNRICKCKNIVLLEDAVCSGKRKLLPDDCDRNCFFFWHINWLEKIKNE